MEDEVTQLRDVLRKLCAEVNGLLGSARDVILEEAGATNLSCLEFRLRQAKVLLESTMRNGV